MSGPDFLIIGVARSGTTWLCGMIEQHPSIEISDPKEPDFLVAVPGGPAYRGPGDGLIQRRVVSEEPEWRDLFSGHPDTKRGESSVSTVFHPDVSIPRIDRYAPHAQLIVSLRAPWARARSAHQLMRGKGLETLDFAAALEAEPQRRAAGWHPIWLYREQSLYAKQVEPFVEHFGSRLLVLEYERLVSETSQLLRVQRHLGVEGLDLPGLGVINESVEPRSAVLRRGVRWLHSVPFVRRRVKPLLPQSVRRGVKQMTSRTSQSAGDEYPPGFVESFSEDLRMLRAVLGEDAPSWSREV